MEPVSRRARWVAAIAWTAFACAGALRAAPEEDDITPNLVIVDEIQPEVKGSTVTVYLSGRAPQLPANTRVDFRLTLFSSDVDKMTMKLDASRKFLRRPFRIRKSIVYGPGYCLVATINLGVQEKKVQEALKQLAPKIFVSPLSNWSWNYYDKTFRMGSEEQERAQLASTRAFFKRLLQDAIKLNNQFADSVTAAKDGKKYASGGKLDGAAWRRWLDGDWRKRVLQLQRKLRKWTLDNTTLSMKHSAGVSAAWLLLETIARRSQIESKALYRANELEVHAYDISNPPGLEDLRVGTSRTRRISTIRRRLLQQYVKVIDNFQLDLPKPGQKKPAAAKKGAAPKKEAGGVGGAGSGGA